MDTVTERPRDETSSGWEGIWRGQYKFDDLDRMLNLGNVAMSDIR